MTQRNQLIVLGTLVGLMGIVAYLEFGRSNTPNAAPAPGAPAATAPAGAGTETKPAESAQDSGPSADDLRELAGWFDILQPNGAVTAQGGTQVFGMAQKEASPSAETEPPSSQEPSQTPWMTEPGKLDGIIKVGNGAAEALFQDQLYKVGDRIRGTTFTVDSISDDSVTLKSGDHVIQRFWHD